MATVLRGRAAIVEDAASGEKRVGRFGWKSQHATLLVFASDAYVNEMGITNDVFQKEGLGNIGAEKAGAIPCQASGGVPKMFVIAARGCVESITLRTT